MARYEIADMNTGELTAKQVARELAQQKSFDKFLAKCSLEMEANGDDSADYDSHGRYIGKPFVAAVLEDIEF